LVAGGETTVTLKGNGLGGRNQEVALGAVTTIAGLKDVAIISLATDGEDGPTNAAGGVVTGETYERGKKMGLSPQEFLQRNDSFHYLETSGNLVVPGVTGTNVNDLTFLFAF
jgi:hydroxypyruvate reductase